MSAKIYLLGKSYPFEEINKNLIIVLQGIENFRYQLSENDKLKDTTVYDEVIKSLGYKTSEVNPREVSFHIEKAGDIVEVFFFYNVDKILLNERGYFEKRFEYTNDFSETALYGIIYYLEALKIIPSAEVFTSETLAREFLSRKTPTAYSN